MKQLSRFLYPVAILGVLSFGCNTTDDDDDPTSCSNGLSNPDSYVSGSVTGLQQFNFNHAMPCGSAQVQGHGILPVYDQSSNTLGITISKNQEWAIIFYADIDELMAAADYPVHTVATPPVSTLMMPYGVGGTDYLATAGQLSVTSVSHTSVSGLHYYTLTGTYTMTCSDGVGGTINISGTLHKIAFLGPEP